ncbi:phosphoserine aminotransferase [Paraburkholderia eburnea]|uniref:Phosphoserine aminotransferase n=1 Tax=Paraburkholderia eburnea TaxID=1189126 RepID=A0A2S4MDP6_9BURK|nr:3-phosphoserine/phosphohydroxythreonine transaminase [Paraburkholderia eburnea]POR52844.1 phosphoserine aminotransferase [Paraburkholderia eburnea]PRZ23712.1 phosphoserine aminotransferase [Paraburkholderia eburnea]
MTTRRNELNFSGGPGALPATVLEQTQRAIEALPETGLSVLGMSHRSEWFLALVDEASRNLRNLLGLSEDYEIAFMQGGSSLQFATIPMNFAGLPFAPPQYVSSGYWSRRATAEAQRVYQCGVAWDGAHSHHSELPELAKLDIDPRAAYLHYVSNETVEGLQFGAQEAPSNVALIADMSSDFLSGTVDTDRYSMIYAHAQKNLGPSGVTVVLVKRALLERIPDGLPAILDYRTHITHHSNYNTPPVFAIYVLTLVSRWLRDDIGGLRAMGAINERKAAMIYGTLETLGDAVRIHAKAPWRSRMNVAFSFGDEQLDRDFVEFAGERQMTGLEGHRSIGGIRASLYNAVTEQATASLCETIRDFAAKRL